MKRFLVLLVCACGMTLSASAQVGVGLRGGALLSQVYVDLTANSNLLNPRPTFVQGMEVGVFGRLMNNKNLGMQLEVNYSRQGWHIYPATEGEHQRELEVIQVPVLSYLQIGRGRFKFTLQAGAFAGYVLSRTDIFRPNPEVESTNLVVYDHQEELPWQYGIVAGGGPAYHFSFGMIQLEARFSHALSDLIRTDLNRSDDFDSFRLQTITFGLQWVYMF